MIILCGGRGTRLQHDVPDLPKPLVEIGGRPILWHVIQIYASQGHDRFILCTGYKSDVVESFVESSDWPPGVTVECVDTGLDTQTGGRINRVRELVHEGTFMATYADGVADIDLRALTGHHTAHGDAATMCAVRPELQFGIALIGEGDRIEGFREKPRAEHWINGGFFVFEPRVFDYLTDDCVLEREPLEGMAEDGQLHAFRHTGFWKCMDTLKDATALNDLWSSERPPWKMWN